MTLYQRMTNTRKYAQSLAIGKIQIKTTICDYCIRMTKRAKRLALASISSSYALGGHTVKVTTETIWQFSQLP